MMIRRQRPFSSNSISQQPQPHHVRAVTVGPRMMVVKSSSATILYGEEDLPRTKVGVVDDDNNKRFIVDCTTATTSSSSSSPTTSTTTTSSSLRDYSHHHHRHEVVVPHASYEPQQQQPSRREQQQQQHQQPHHHHQQCQQYKRPGRCVRFLTTRTGQIATQIHVYETNNNNNEQEENFNEQQHDNDKYDDDVLLYYSPAERLSMQSESKCILRRFARFHPNYCTTLEHIYEQGTKNHTPTTTPNHCDNTLDLDTFIQCTAQVRGLETNLSKVIRQHRQNAIDTVLKLQETMLDHYYDNNNHTTTSNQHHTQHQFQTMLALGLRACSVHVTQKSRTFAIFMASIDAEEAILAAVS